MKKEFIKAEIEVIRFEKQDIITTSTTTIIVGGQDAQGCPINNPPPIP
ncbi:MAG: hypothetical protein IJK71_11380 [Clostridia bacterium]|nr:hypothetical protein [Clostridia bacterium]